jgi:hypothetical protein
MEMRRSTGHKQFERFVDKSTVSAPLGKYYHLLAGVPSLVTSRHPQAGIYSHRPSGLGRDELKWEMSDNL